jgi:Flp pilus assembly protein TadG
MLSQSAARKSAEVTEGPAAPYRSPGVCRSRISRGQSAVEFAMIATLVLVVLIVGVQFALIGQAYLAVGQGASVLARYAAVNPNSFGTYNGTASVPAAALALLSPTINDGNLTVTIHSYVGGTTTTTSSPQPVKDYAVVTVNYSAINKIFLPTSTLLGISFPTALSAKDQDLYE